MKDFAKHQQVQIMHDDMESHGNNKCSFGEEK